jgi:hypothetical protein
MSRGTDSFVEVGGVTTTFGIERGMTIGDIKGLGLSVWFRWTEV